MKTTGKRHLINNDYNEITLIENNSIECNVIGDENTEQGILVGSFEYSLKKEKNDSKKALLIVDYFLNYNNILELNQFVRLNNDNKQFLIVKSNNRILNLSLNNDNEIGEKITNDIVNKYQIDRIKYIFNLLDDINVINLIPSYDKTGYNLSNEKLDLYYLKSNKGIYSFEEAFIEELIKEYINIKNSKVVNKKNNNKTYFNVIRQIEIGDSEINICDSKLQENDKYFIKQVDSIIDEYRKEQLDIKQKQLKLEGF